MRKSDLILIAVILVANTFLLLNNFDSSKPTTANVYYEDSLVLQIDLTVDGVYSVEGTNGEVEITVKDGDVAITKETSPQNICSKQGYVDVSIVPLICLPNKVVVEASESDVDEVAR